MMKNYRNVLCIVFAILLCLNLIGCGANGSGGTIEQSEATEPTEVTETTEVSDVTEATEATDVTEATEATEDIEDTEATEVTEATEAVQATDPVTATEPTAAPTEPAQTEPQATKPAATEPADTQPGHTHSYSDTVVAATCTEKGYTKHTCDCGDSYNDTYVDAVGHSFGSWTVTKTATQEAEGEETRTCSACGAVEKKTVAKLPAEKLDVATLQANAMAYAASLGFTPYYGGPLPGYNPPGTHQFTTMSEAQAWINGGIYALYMTFTNLYGSVEGFQIHVSVVDNGDGTFTSIEYYG